MGDEHQRWLTRVEATGTVFFRELSQWPAGSGMFAKSSFYKAAYHATEKLLVIVRSHLPRSPK